MRMYEAVYIVDPMLEEDQQTAIVERFKALVESNGGEIAHLERWERRRLAYEVKGRREGYYVIMNFRGTPATEAELGRVLGITDNVIRHMIVRMDERTAQKSIADMKTAAEAKARAAAEAEARAAEAAAAAPVVAPAPVAAPAPTPPAPEPEPEAAPAEDSPAVEGEEAGDSPE